MPALQMGKRISRRLAIQIVRLLRNLRHRSEARQPGHAARDGRAQSVDGLDAQARRISQQVPAQPPLVIQNIARDLKRRAVRVPLPVPRRCCADRKASSTRDRISPAALRVNVIATTASGVSTVSSSFR